MLLLALAFASSGIFQLAVSGHAAVAAGHSHGLASIAELADTEPCCPEHNGQPNGNMCSTAAGCSLFVPVTGSAPIMQSGKGQVEMTPEAVHSGRVLSPRLRPPKTLPNV